MNNIYHRFISKYLCPIVDAIYNTIYTIDRCNARNKKLNHPEAIFKYITVLKSKAVNNLK